MKKSSPRTLSFYVLSFLIPLVILLAFAVVLKLAPFGGRNLLSSDLSNQYAPFLAYFTDIIQGKANLFYSFSIGLGDSSFALAAYYLLSPFNFLLLFFKDGQTDVAITWLIFLKIAAISTAMFFYLHQHFKKADFSKLAFALAFAFSSFASLYLLNLMWLDALILLPFIIWALERLIKTEKGILYTVLLFTAIVTNYYLGYMICLFVILYFFYVTLMETKFDNFKTYWSQIKGKFWSFTRYSVFAGMMSMFVLIPAVIGMLKTGKTNNSITTFLPYPHFSSDFFQQLGIDNSDYATRLSHLPSFYAGSLVILLALLYFQMPFRKKEKRLSALFLALIFLSFWIQTANAVWHMFQQAAGFPYRNSFMMSFLLILLAYQVWQRRRDISSKMLLRTLIVMALLLTLGYVTGLLAGLKFAGLKLVFPGSWTLYAYALALLLLNGLLLWKFKGKALLWLLLLDLSFSFYKDLSAIPGNSTKLFQQEYQVVTKLADSVKTHQPEAPFYRTDSQLHFYNVGYNQSLQSGYYGVASYSSTLNNKLRLTQSALGQVSRNERRISAVGLTDFSSYLLDVNYEIINSESLVTNPINSHGMDIIQTKNAQAPSIGYFLPDLSKLTFSTTSQDYFGNQDKLAQQILGKKDFSLFSNQTIEKLEKNHFSLTPTESGDLFIKLAHSAKRKLLTVTVDGHKLLDRAAEVTGGLLYLGDVDQGKIVDIQFSSPVSEKFTNNSAKILDANDLSEIVNTMATHKANLLYNSRHNTFEGSVDNKTDQKLFLSLPYDKDWQFKIDGKIVAAKPTLNQAFTAISVPAGSHLIKISYQPMILWYAMTFSVISLVVFVVWEFSSYLNHRYLKRMAELIQKAHESNDLAKS